MTFLSKEPVTLDHQRYVGVSFGEFSAWHAHGETAIVRSRLIHVPTNETSGHAINMLLGRLPALALDDEEGVLLVRLVAGSLADDDMDSEIARIPIERVEGVVPLTNRARNILFGRLEGFGVNPEPAIFEGAYNAWSYRRRLRFSETAGDRLVRLMAPAAEWEPSSQLRRAAGASLAQSDFSNAGVDVELASAPTSWVSKAFGWTRHKPYEDGHLNHLWDAGSVLRDVLVDDQLQALRAAGKAVKNDVGNAAGLGEIVSSAPLKEAARQLQAASPEAFPAGLATLILYLRWQERFHALRAVDTELLADDVKHLPPHDPDVLSALWLLGFYVGIDYVTPIVYAASPLSFSWYEGKGLKLSPEPGASDPAGEHSAAPTGPDELDQHVDEMAKDGQLGDADPSTVESSPSEPTQPGLLAGDHLASRYGEVPWVQFRGVTEAIRAALYQAQQQSPDLTPEQLFDRVYREWFGYTKKYPAKLRQIRDVHAASH